MIDINLPIRNNKTLEILLKEVNESIELNTLWKASNITAIDRLGFSDHGPVHIRIVTNIALKLLRILIKKGITPTIVKNYAYSNEDAEVVVFLGSILHDIGHSIHRVDHELLSTFLAIDILENLLKDVYDKEKKEIMKVEILHCIYSHRSDITPLTIEAGVVKIADALDMAKGRARIPFNAGKVNIYSVSAMAIESIEIGEGANVPISIKIKMRNSAGIFQIDELLKNKINTSGIKEYIEVVAEIGKEEKIIEKSYTI
ncbi:MAG: HD domain-containing protein [Thermoplasmata archaeon]